MSVQVKTELPQDSSPILAEVVRGQMVESRHHASVAVVDAHGGIVRAWGDVELPIYGRSIGLSPATIGMIEGASTHWMSAPASADPDELTRQLADLAWRGLRGVRPDKDRPAG